MSRPKGNNSRLSPEKIRKVLSILENEYGNTGTALKFRSKFQLLVSTMMAAQSTDKQVNKITKALFVELPDATAFSKLSPEELEEKIKQVGLFRSKARNIVAASKMILDEFNGRVPDSREALMKLPGVGRKTANVVLSVGFQQDAIAVDTHVFRVSNRIGLAGGKDVRETEEHLMRNIPQDKWSAAHHWLIWHGRKICKAQKPACGVCPIRKYCWYAQKP